MRWHLPNSALLTLTTLISLYGPLALSPSSAQIALILAHNPGSFDDYVLAYILLLKSGFMRLMSNSKWKLKKKRLVSRKENVHKFSGSSPSPTEVERESGCPISVGGRSVSSLLFKFTSVEVPLTCPSSFPVPSPKQSPRDKEQLNLIHWACVFPPLLLLTRRTTLLDPPPYTFYRDCLYACTE